MCGIVVAARIPDVRHRVADALARLRHRGPDGSGVWSDETMGVALGHSRLSIIDLSSAGAQPMESHDGRYILTFNGEIYNYLELREQLSPASFRSRTDSEVLLTAWMQWGPACLDRLIGMFAFAIWDKQTATLVAVRDRFGVKPLYVAQLGGGLALASEIKALHTLGVSLEPDDVTWATYLTTGVHEHSSHTFWKDIECLPAGSMLTWSADRGSRIERWYDLAARVGDAPDVRATADVMAEYKALVADSVRLRFRADVPVGINLSGGVDSSTLLGLVHAVQGTNSTVKAFTFATGDADYDETPWVEQMLDRTQHELVTCTLSPGDVPALASRIATMQDEPFGGLPTLAYANLFARARQEGVLVLLDGQGMDEQWAGYDYYRSAMGGDVPIVQGSTSPATRADMITPTLRERVAPFVAPSPFSERLKNLQLRDALHTKLPRALRYNDRISMAASTELREPFLDHRVFELAMRQPADRKIHGDTGKWLLRQLASELVPDPLRLAPKRPVQTPQREWLRGPLREWATDHIETALRLRSQWFERDVVREHWNTFLNGRGDNSYWVWQLISIAL